MDKNINEASIISIVNQMLDEAHFKKVSDIHIEPNRNNCRIRFRRDGLLYERMRLNFAVYMQMSSRLKIMANLDIAEKRLPQDGRIYLANIQQEIRINTCPTLFGEKIVIRLLQTDNIEINALGMLDEQLSLFKKQLEKPQGLILVTGPTGSGKTLTLYSALNFLNKIEKNIITIEDPIEITLPGITQINVHHKIGLSFPSILKTILRQDPDIIMIGEIRDDETASIATQAAQTGHLVLATLHTNNVFDCLNRLRTLGISPLQIKNSLKLILSQRLLRKKCDACNALTKNACEECHYGYKGRTGVF